MSIHAQAWDQSIPEAVRRLPAGALVKSVHDLGILVQAAAINPRVRTLYRHWLPDSEYRYGNNQAEARQLAREFFNRFMDETFLQHAAAVDFVEELNEYVPWTLSPGEVAARVRWAEAAAWVWANEYRTWSEFADIRLVLCNQSVGNDIPQAYAEIALEYDAVLSYHAYSKYDHGARDSGDWRYHSGRWHYNEEAWGLRPDWIFTEVGPYFDAQRGWKAPECIGSFYGYLAAMRAWFADVAQTPAYREGRTLGYAQFTTCADYQGWANYRTQGSELVAMADLCAELWQPGDEAPPAETGGTATTNRYWNLRSAPVLDATARLVTLPPGTTLDYAGTTDGDEWNGSTEWVKVIGYVHSAGVNVEPAGQQTPEFAFYAFPTDYRYVTQAFGANPASYAKFGLPGHEGVDFRAPEGTPIYAVADGTVSHVDAVDDSAYGQFVEVNHPGGYRTLYAHLSAIDVDEGQRVNAGQRIGSSGNTGNSTGAHLHLTLYRPGHGQPGWPLDIVDPTEFVLPFEPEGMFRLITISLLVISLIRERQARRALERERDQYRALVWHRNIAAAAPPRLKIDYCN